MLDQDPVTLGTHDATADDTIPTKDEVLCGEGMFKQSVIVDDHDGEHLMTQKHDIYEGRVVYTPSDGSSYPVIRSLAPGEPGYDLEPKNIVARQESTEEFLAFLSSLPAADDAPHADSR